MSKFLETAVVLVVGVADIRILNILSLQEYKPALGYSFFN